MKRFSVEQVGSDILEVKVDAGARLEDFVEAIDNAADNSTKKKRLWSFDQAIVLSETDVREFASYVRDHPKPPEMVAIVAKMDVNFGIARQYSVYRATPNYQQKVFRSRQDALDWLDSN